ncbi:MAG: DNA polymerase III subunit delta [Polyangiaceae bacterium UTPRO1]|jgi:DNA polymerase-3 subunit delta|nr:DNA polymerase III subunit delta [Myxococcales bacterium]OQY64631.1 MAG: DNA polymerase III subunit delta [Polyangiaceae bacterium UTPRO1]
MAAPAAHPLYLLAEERRGEFDGWRADRALADIRKRLERSGSVAVHGYRAGECDVQAIAAAIETPSLFGARTLIVVRGVESLDERSQERLTAALEFQAPQVTVAIVSRGGDMRRRFFARCRQLATRIPVDHPRAGEMRGFADAFARERGCELDEAARELLLECVGRDLLLLASELDKLAAAVTSRAVGVDDVRRITAPGREHGNFEVADAFCARDAAAATRLLACALDEGAQPVAVIGALAASLKPLVAGAELVARGRSVDEAVRELALAPYQRFACQRGLRAYRASELRRAYSELADIDLAAKSGGDGRALLELWLLRACRPAPRSSASPRPS